MGWKLLHCGFVPANNPLPGVVQNQGVIGCPVNGQAQVCNDLLANARPLVSLGWVEQHGNRFELKGGRHPGGPVQAVEPGTAEGPGVTENLGRQQCVEFGCNVVDRDTLTPQPGPGSAVNGFSAF